MKNEILEIELKILEGTNQVIVVCAETGRRIGHQASTIITSQYDGMTIAEVTFDIQPKKEKKNDY